MALPFNPPNPYGSYFNFSGSYGGDPTPSLWRQPNYPNLGTPVSQGVAAASGSPSGGANPTTQEFLNTRSRDIAFQQFIDRAIKDDPRTRTMGNMLLDGIYGSDARAKAAAMARIGGPDAYNGMIGTMMSLPGVSGYFGGSARSLAVGSLAVATSGLTMNGYGVFGDKSMNLRFADEMMRQVNSKFYQANGNPILSMTNGLNRDQMGGVMMQAASQGAFTGLDMGMFQKLDAAGNRVKFIANSDTTAKITEFMKSATKALGSLIDVYGNISSGELMQKAQQITGLDLSRLQNASIISERLTRLRTTAANTGIDVQSAMDMSARAVDYGSAIGLRPEMAGTAGNFAANQGMRDFKSRQMNTHGFYTNTISPQEAQFSIVRDLAGMSQDPLGARFSALEMLIKNNNVGTEEAQALRSRAAGMPANAVGVSGLDAMIQGRFGVSAAGLIRGMGGPAALQQQLDDTQQDNLLAMSSRNLGARQSSRILANMYRGGLMPTGSTSAQIEAMHSLVTTFDGDTLDKILGGDAGDMAGIMGQAVGGDTSQLMAAAKMIRGMPGGMAAMQNVRSSIQSDELTRMFVTKEGRAKQAWMNSGDISDDFRGSLLGGGFMAGMMDKYSGNDPLSNLMWLYKMRPGVVAGIGRNEGINADFGSMVNTDGSLKIDEWKKAALGWQTGLMKTTEGRSIAHSIGLGDITTGAVRSGLESDNLLKAFNALRNPDWRQQNLSGFDLFSINGGRNVGFARKTDMALHATYGDDIQASLAMADQLESAAGGQTAESVMLRQRAGMLSSGGVIYHRDGKGKWSDTGGRATAAQLAGAHAQNLKLAKQIIMQGNISDAVMKTLQPFSGDLNQWIDDQESIFKRQINPATASERERKIANLEEAKARLAGSKNAVLGDAATPSNITGTLTLLDMQGNTLGKMAANLKQSQTN